MLVSFNRFGIRGENAELLRQLCAAVERLSNVSYSPPLEVLDGMAGPLVRIAAIDGFWARITENHCAEEDCPPEAEDATNVCDWGYSWVELFPVSRGLAEQANSRRGGCEKFTVGAFGPAFEVSENRTDVKVGTIVFLRPGANDEGGQQWVFERPKRMRSATCSGTDIIGYLPDSD